MNNCKSNLSFGLWFGKVFSGFGVILLLLVTEQPLRGEPRVDTTRLGSRASIRELGQIYDTGAYRTVYREVICFPPGSGDWIEKSEYAALGRFLRAVQKDTVVRIHLKGWADTTGAVGGNLRLSQRRAAAVGRYLARKGIDTRRIRIEGCGEDTLATPAYARRVELCGILAETRETAEKPDTIKVTGKELLKRNKQTTAGTAVSENKEVVRKDKVMENKPLQEPQPTVSQREPERISAADKTENRLVTEGELPYCQRYFGIKSNLVAWAGTIMNMAADVQVGKHVSVELPLLWCPWYVSERHAVRTFILQPEARWWLAAPGEGHFFGVHAHIGWFNVKWNRDRYQDTGRPFFGSGISYGYLLPFGEHWAGEFTLGAGYANMRYDTYYNIDNGARIDTRTRNYWGITRVGISLVYRFNLKK